MHKTATNHRHKVVIEIPKPKKGLHELAAFGLRIKITNAMAAAAYAADSTAESVRAAGMAELARWA